jgi:hypothetical protein
LLSLLASNTHAFLFKKKSAWLSSRKDDIFYNVGHFLALQISDLLDCARGACSVGFICLVRWKVSGFTHGKEKKREAPFGCAEKPAEKHYLLICCERKALFWLKNKLKKYEL